MACCSYGKELRADTNEGDVDANVNQRLARAVTEAFVAMQVGEMINNLTALPSQEAKVVGRLYKLVGYYLRCRRSPDFINCIVLANEC